MHETASADASRPPPPVREFRLFGSMVAGTMHGADRLPEMSGVRLVGSRSPSVCPGGTVTV